MIAVCAVYVAELYIPALNWRTASVLGLPIPPPLNIAIRPNKFEVGGCSPLNLRLVLAVLLHFFAVLWQLLWSSHSTI